MKIQSVCVLGGTGFVGHKLVSQLIQANKRVRILTRHRERHRDFLVYSSVELVEADVFDSETLQRQFEGMDAVINLVGILNERGHKGEGFYKAHVELPRRILAAAQAAGVKRLLHMSALKADAAKGSSHYLRSKGEGEDLVHAEADGLAVTSFRPSVIFGPDDSFFNRFAKLLKTLPCSLPLAMPGARFQPVYVGDVANAYVRALEDEQTFGQRIDLCGPRVYTLKELVQYTAELTGQKNIIIPLPKFVARIQANLMEFAPGKPFSRDNFASLQTDSVCRPDTPCQPTPVEAVVPGYLAATSVRAKYYRHREHAGRDQD